MIVYIENPKDSTRKLLELINEYSKIAGYKINTQKSLAFLYTKNESIERENKETIPLTIETKRIKYLGIYLPKETFAAAAAAAAAAKSLQSCPTLCDPIIAAGQASLFITISRSSLRLMSIESVMPSSHLILCLVYSVILNFHMHLNLTGLSLLF